MKPPSHPQQSCPTGHGESLKKKQSQVILIKPADSKQGGNIVENLQESGFVAAAEGSNQHPSPLQVTCGEKVSQTKHNAHLLLDETNKQTNKQTNHNAHLLLNDRK